MRPSWPAPMMPIFMRRWAGAAGRVVPSTLSVCAARNASSAARISRMRIAEDRRGQQRRIGRARDADRQRADRNAGRHLHDRQQRIEAAQRLRLHRHAEHRQRGLRRRHARQMRRTAGAGDDDLQAACPCGRRVFEQQVGRAMRGDDAHFVRDAEALEHFGGGFEGLPVGGGPHDDANERFHRGIVHSAPEKPTFRTPARASRSRRNSCRDAAGGLRRGLFGAGLPGQRAHLLQQLPDRMRPPSSVQAAASSATSRSRHCSSRCSRRTRCRSVSLRCASACADRLDVDVAQDLADVHFLPQARAMARDRAAGHDGVAAAFPAVRSASSSASGSSTSATPSSRRSRSWRLSSLLLGTWSSPSVEVFAEFLPARH